MLLLKRSMMNNKKFVKCVLLSFFATTANAAHFVPLNGEIFKTLKGAPPIKKINEVTLQNGKVKVKYQQMFNGIPVYGENISVTKKDNDFVNWAGNWLNDINADLSSTHVSLTSKEAISQFKHQIPTLSDNEITHESATLYVTLKNHKARLAYRVSYLIKGVLPSRPTGFVDAQTGKLIQHWDGLTKVVTKGPGGNEKLGKYNFGTELPLMVTAKDCILSTNNVGVYDYTDSAPDIFSYENCEGKRPQNNYKEVNGAYSPINDAFYFGTYIVNKFQSLYRMKPTKKRLEIKVHVGEDSDQASWNGETVSLGDGNSNTYPLATLDIIAHEVAHGFTENNAGLENRGQSGAVNESFSDITAELMKAETSKKIMYPKWQFGESVVKGERGTAIRYLNDPSKDGVSIEHMDNYNENMDVHYAAGIFNKAFYNLASKRGWSIRKAHSVFLLANQIFWHATSSFEQAACGVKRAASDLKYNTKNVISAFSKVGVDASCGELPEGSDVQLNKRVSIDNIFGLKDSIKYYYIDVPEYQSFLNIEINSCVGDPELYLRYSAHPTFIEYDCRPYTPGGHQTCSVKNPRSGRYYIMLHGYSIYSGLSLTGNYFR